MIEVATLILASATTVLLIVTICKNSKTMKEKSTQKKIKKLKDQLNRCRGNGRMAFKLSQRIDTLENTK